MKTSAVEREVLQRLVGFGRFTRHVGLPVGPGRVLTFCRAAACLDPFDPVDLRLAARSALVARPEDLASLDTAFDLYFGRRREGSGGIGPSSDPEAMDASPGPGPSDRSADEKEGLVLATSWSHPNTTDEGGGMAAIRIVASETERMRRKDFAELTDDERRAASALIRRLAVSMPLRRSRRHRLSPEGERFDLRRTLRRSLRTEGEPLSRAWRRRATRPRALVLVLDVSGSMAPYGRPLVEFAHAAAHAGRRVEVFCFGTRLTRITRALGSRDPSVALAAVGRAVADWEGGTRIGASIKELLDRWGSRSALRGSVLVLCSDGLERGDPAALARQMGRLSRLVHRLIWVNPLKGSPRYEPLARGMAASLPFVDAFLPGHDLESLEALAEAVTAS